MLPSVDSPCTFQDSDGVPLHLLLYASHNTTWRRTFFREYYWNYNELWNGNWRWNDERKRESPEKNHLQLWFCSPQIHYFQNTLFSFNSTHLKLLLRIVSTIIQAHVKGDQFLYPFVIKRCRLWWKSCLHCLFQIIIVIKMFTTEDFFRSRNRWKITWRKVRAVGRPMKLFPTKWCFICILPPFLRTFTVFDHRIKMSSSSVAQHVFVFPHSYCLFLGPTQFVCNLSFLVQRRT